MNDDKTYTQAEVDKAIDDAYKSAFAMASARIRWILSNPNFFQTAGQLYLICQEWREEDKGAYDRMVDELRKSKDDSQ